MSSFLSNIFGGGAERQAANANRSAYGAYGSDANRTLDGGLANSIHSLTDANSSSNNYLSRNFGLYGDLGTAGNAALDQGRTNQLGALSNIPLQDAGAAYAPLEALAGKYGKTTGLYQDSLGVNGAAGNQNAVDAFHAGPGYEFTRDQGLDAINRRRAAAGMLGSGNADADAIKFGTGLANQTYGSWQDRLAGFVNPELSATSAAASGRAGAATNANSLQAALAQARSGIYGQDEAARLGLAGAVTQGQAGVNNAQAANATALGNSLGNLYSNDAQNRVNVAGTVTGGNVSANNLQAQGEAQGSRNLLGAGMGLASLGAQAFGANGMFGSGGAFGGGGQGVPSTLGNLGSQAFGNGTGYQTNPWSSGGMFGSGGGGWAR